MTALTAADVPAKITPEAKRSACADHPLAPSAPGFGYAGGGFGGYRRCLAPGCRAVFAKHAAKDGNGK